MKNVNEVRSKEKFITRFRDKVYRTQRSLQERAGSLTQNKFFQLALDVLFTGIAIWIAVNWSNPIGYGVMAALIMHYVEWFVRTIKKNYDD